MKTKKMVVVMEEMITVPFRKVPEPLTRTYTVYAVTKKQAAIAVRRAGHKGRLVEVIVNG